jgi:hypothetical protein
VRDQVRDAVAVHFLEMRSLAVVRRRTAGAEG